MRACIQCRWNSILSISCKTDPKQLLSISCISYKLIDLVYFISDYFLCWVLGKDIFLASVHKVCKVILCVCGGGWGGHHKFIKYILYANHYMGRCGKLRHQLLPLSLTFPGEPWSEHVFGGVWFEPVHDWAWPERGVFTLRSFGWSQCGVWPAHRSLPWICLCLLWEAWRL